MRTHLTLCWAWTKDETVGREERERRFSLEVREMEKVQLETQDVHQLKTNYTLAMK